MAAATLGVGPELLDQLAAATLGVRPLLDQLLDQQQQQQPLLFLLRDGVLKRVQLEAEQLPLPVVFLLLLRLEVPCLVTIQQRGPVVPCNQRVVFFVFPLCVLE